MKCNYTPGKNRLHVCASVSQICIYSLVFPHLFVCLRASCTHHITSHHITFFHIKCRYNVYSILARMCMYLSIYLSTYLSTYLPIYLSTYINYTGWKTTCVPYMFLFLHVSYCRSCCGGSYTPFLASKGRSVRCQVLSAGAYLCVVDDPKLQQSSSISLRWSHLSAK